MPAVPTPCSARFRTRTKSFPTQRAELFTTAGPTSPIRKTSRRAQAALGGRAWTPVRRLPATLHRAPARALGRRPPGVLGKVGRERRGGDPVRFSHPLLTGHRLSSPEDIGTLHHHLRSHPGSSRKRPLAPPRATWPAGRGWCW